MKIAVLSPIAWRTPPHHYGPWELVASNTAEGLVRKGHDVTLFATADSQTAGHLDSVCPKPYEEDKTIDPKVWECLHISNLVEKADQFDIIHNHYDFLPLTYSKLIQTPMVTTIHGFTSNKILPVYQKYNANTHYISISISDRSPDLEYAGTVYNGINLDEFELSTGDDDYLLFFGRIHPEKGTVESIEIAKKAGKRLIIAGIVQDTEYFETQVKPLIDGKQVEYIGPVGPEKRSVILGRALALLHPIFFEEPFGLSVAEAQACGTPVIAFNRGSMPELIDHGKTGFICDTIDEAVQHVEESAQIAPKTCRDRIYSKFSIESMVEGYEAIYKQILGGTKTSGFEEVVPAATQY